MSTLPKPRITPAEYLERERKLETRNEYLRGEMFAMTGASRRYNLIALHMGGDLDAQLADRPCEVYANDMRVKVSATGLYTYPDVVIACGAPEFEDAHVDTLLNPMVLIEVLSKSTEAYDRGGKWAHYRSIPSLKDYVLVSTSEPRMELFSRLPDDQWLLRCVTGLEESLEIPSVGCQLRLQKVYHKVSWDEPGED
jgi:Uma2 family endonuclease